MYTNFSCESLARQPLSSWLRKLGFHTTEMTLRVVFSPNGHRLM